MFGTASVVLMCLALVDPLIAIAGAFGNPKSARLVKTRDEQCKYHGFEGFCNNDEYLPLYGAHRQPPVRFSCKHLECARKSKYQTMGGINHDEVDGPQPIEGTYCGRRAVCKLGKCVRTDERQENELYGLRCHPKRVQLSHEEDGALSCLRKCGFTFSERK